MIYTLTLNPAVDYIAHVDAFSVGKILRSRNESVLPGGKGINVSTVLCELGVASVAMGFIAGFTGDAIEDALLARGIGCDFVRLSEGFTRINIKLRSGEETDINGSGPHITEDDLAELFGRLSRLGAQDTLVMAGSIPNGVGTDIYAQIMAKLSGKGIRFVVDAAGDALTASLPYGPFLIKPNTEELGALFGVEISSTDDAAKYGTELMHRGAKNVLVSMGAGGALLLAEDGGVYFVPAYHDTVINTVGAGDSMVAGFLAGYDQTGDFAYAMRLARACGCATAFSEGLAKKADIERLT